MRLSTWIAGIPTVVITIWFALANRSVVSVSFDAFGGSDAAWTFGMPLFVIVFLGVFIGMMAGGAVVWWGQGRWRREARRNSREVTRLTTKAPDSNP